MKIFNQLFLSYTVSYLCICVHKINFLSLQRGVDVIWETYGGKNLETCIQHLGIKSRLLLVGGITAYKEENREALPKPDLSSLPEMVKNAHISL